MPQAPACEPHERSARCTRPDDGDNILSGGTATRTSSETNATGTVLSASHESELQHESRSDAGQEQEEPQAASHHTQQDTGTQSTNETVCQPSTATCPAEDTRASSVSGRAPIANHFLLPLHCEELHSDSCQIGDGNNLHTNSIAATPTTPIECPTISIPAEIDQHQKALPQVQQLHTQQFVQCQLNCLSANVQSPTQRTQTFIGGGHTFGDAGGWGAVPRAVAEDSGMPRSPSHDSFATDLSLLSLSSCGSDVSRVIRCGSTSCFASQSCVAGTPPGATPAVAPAACNVCCEHAIEIAAIQGQGTATVMASGRPISAGGASDVIAESPVGLDECAVPPLIQVHDATLSSSSTSVVMCTSQGGLAGDHCRTAALHNRCAARNSLLQVPAESYGGSRVHDAHTLFEEESEAIRNCSLLSSAVLGGLMKSFSTGDISHALDLEPPEPLRNTVSEELITDEVHNVAPWNHLEVPVNQRLDCASRSCSTWVAVGDMHSAQSTSQLPSPSARCGSGNIPGFTAADLVRSVNKKVRQMYIRRRLLSTYKALERLTKSQLNLSEALQATAPHDLKKNIQEELRQSSSTSAGAGRTDGRKTPLTARDVERDRGKPLTKYERNMMIFNWLHNLDDEGDNAAPPFELPSNSGNSNGGPQQTVQQAA